MFLSLGISHQITCVYTPQQNRVAERKHTTILDMARALRFQVDIPLWFWGQCMTIVVNILNRLLSYKSLFELFHSHDPSLSHIRTFECICYVTCIKVLDKFSHRVIIAVLLGYSSSRKEYLLYDLHSKSCLMMCFPHHMIILQSLLL